MKNELEISNEEILLLELCRLSFTMAQTGEIGELVRCVSDWDYFASLANEHGVVALAYHNLEKLVFLPQVPEKIATTLNNALLLSLSRNAFHTSAISEVLRILNDENIKTRFTVISHKPIELKCRYCEKITYENQVVIR